MRLSNIFLVALALFGSFAAATNVAEESSLSNLINSLEDNLDSASLDELEEEEDLAAGRMGTGTGGVGTGGMTGGTGVHIPGGLTDNFAPTQRSVKFTTRKATLHEFAGSVDIYVELEGGASSTDSVVSLQCTESASKTTELWNYTPRIATCPRQITIPAGQTNTHFKVWAFDNDLVDGDATITIALGHIISGSVPLAIPQPVAHVTIKDDDVNKPEPVNVNPTRCDPRLPLEIAIRFFGDRLANQFYTQTGAKGQYFCTYTGVTRSNWAFGVRSIQSFRMTSSTGAANRWQLWWNQFNLPGQGEIRYESLARNIVNGIQGPYVKVNGFGPAGQVQITKVSDAITFACLSVSGAGVTEFNQFYRYEVTGTEFVRFRGVTTSNIVLVAAPANKFDFNSGFWYFVKANSFVPFYSSVNRGGPPTGAYKAGQLATGTGLPVVTVSSGCPAKAQGRCVAVTGSNQFKVNQVYMEKLGGSNPRLTIFVGHTYPAWSIAKYTFLASEPFSDFYFVSFQARQIYYANKRGTPIDVSYYAVTSDPAFQGTLKVNFVNCPRMRP